MKNEKGSAFVLVTFTMMIIFILGMTLLHLSFGEFTIAHNQVDQVKAYYIAEAGIEKALANIEIDDIMGRPVGYSVDLPVGEDSFGDGKFYPVSLTVLDKEPNHVAIKLKCTGFCNEAKKDIVVKAKIPLDNMEITPYSALIATEKIDVQEQLVITGNAYIPSEGIEHDRINITGDKFSSDNIILLDGEIITNKYYQKAFSEGCDHILYNKIIDTIVLDSLDEGGTYFVKGETEKANLEIMGNYKKNITLFVDGDITITDDLISDNKNNHMLNILTNGNLFINVNSKESDEESILDAFLFVTDEVDIGDNINVNGGVICGSLKTTAFGSITIHPTIYYHPEIELITSEDGDVIDIEYWREGTDIL